MISCSRRTLLLLYVLVSLSYCSWMFYGPGIFSLEFSVFPAQGSELIPITQNVSPISEDNPASLSWPPSRPQRILTEHTQGHSTLGIASEIYVLSLPSRADRRATMDRLRTALSLEWTYVPALPFDHPAVSHALECERDRHTKLGKISKQFQWPNFSLANTSDDWSMTPLKGNDDVRCGAHNSLKPASEQTNATTQLVGAVAVSTPAAAIPSESQSSLSPLTCATENYLSGAEYTPSLPAYLILSPAKIACWMSHLSLIERIAAADNHSTTAAPRAGESIRGQGTIQSMDDVSIVLEDDIDMEVDIRERLRSVWSALPQEWDIVFLGHCWSNESYYPPLALSQQTDHSTVPTTLRPSFAPKCTHAYALTRTGARRLLLHLRYPPFAYSRALDQAFSWLIQSGRLKAFSVVPSLVVQRKADKSDIDSSGTGFGSTWRDHLQNGVLGD